MSRNVRQVSNLAVRIDSYLSKRRFRKNSKLRKSRFFLRRTTETQVMPLALRSEYPPPPRRQAGGAGGTVATFVYSLLPTPQTRAAK